MAGAATGPEFDPRYDPRFQRGWTPGESDGAPTAERAARAERVAPPEPVSPAAPSSGEPVSPFAPPEDRPVAAEADPVDAVDPPPADDPPGPPGAPPMESEPRPTPGPVTPPSIDEATEQDSARIIRVAIAAAWVLAGAATLIGFGLVWTFVASDDPYGPSGDEIEALLRVLAQFVAPSLLSTGLLGIVVLIVIDGVRRARRLGAPRDGTEGRSS